MWHWPECTIIHKYLYHSNPIYVWHWPECIIIHKSLYHNNPAYIHVDTNPTYGPAAGKVGVELRPDWVLPSNENDPGDASAAQEGQEFSFGLFGDPIFKGDFSTTVKTRAGSSLQPFTSEEKELLEGKSLSYMPTPQGSTFHCIGQVLSELIQSLHIVCEPRMANVHTGNHTSPSTSFCVKGRGGGVYWLLNIPATCKCISGTGRRVDREAWFGTQYLHPRIVIYNAHVQDLLYSLIIFQKRHWREKSFQKKAILLI